MTGREDVSLLIDGQDYAYWQDIEINLAIDNHYSIGFTAPFEPARKFFRDTFRPFSFKPLQVRVDDAPLFTGTLVDVAPTVEAGAQRVAVSGYSKAAVLAECDMPAGSVPFEANGLTLRQIAQRLTAPFGVSVVMSVPDGTPFHRVNTKSRKIDGKAEQDQQVQDFLVELVKQQGCIISSTAEGDLLILKSVAAGNPIAALEEGLPPVVSVVPTFDPQSYYSEITGFTSAKRGRVGSKYTERNQRLSGGVLRSKSFRLDDVEKADAPAAVKAKMGRMFAACVSYVINVPTWRDPSGDIWQPNTTLTLLAPGAMIYRTTEFLIRDVTLKLDAKEATASLGVVLPGAFSGEQPPFMPWEEP